ncbi:MAG: ribosome maturation factor RimM [Burkholderiales bacterium]|nr:ribosome maturation factor RimM [Burkholderiales bacterium]
MSDGTPPFPSDAVEVGRIVGAWGVKGALKVKPFSARPEALVAARHWFLRASDAAPAAKSPPLPPVLQVTSTRTQGDAIVAVCRDIADRAAAEALAGARVFVARSSFPKAGAGEYYWVDLIGLDVRNRAGEPLGKVSTLLDTGAHCVLCVVGPEDADAERLIPFVAAYVDRVDLPGRVIHVDWQRDY